MALYLIENATITSDTVTIKFGRTIKISSLVNSKFPVFTTAATPQQVTSPFKTIEALTDYNQISRTLTLHWKTVLAPGTEYAVYCEGLVDSSGITVPTESIEFTTAGQSATPSYIADHSIPVVNEILVEDKSLRPEITTGYQILAKNPDFYIVSIDPSDGEFYLPPTYNRGRVTITFNQRPASNFLNNKYFRCQRKKIQKAPSRWEEVYSQVSMHLWKPEVYVDFPTLSATPSFYNDVLVTENGNVIFLENPGYIEEDLEQLEQNADAYFQRGYKYRIIVSGEVGV